jgi:arylsulfatase A-like enzyme
MIPSLYSPTSTQISFFPTTILSILLFVIVNLLPTPSQCQSSRPNFLLIVIDDLNGNVGILGDNLGHTPRMDELFSRGLTLTNHHVQVSECSPSRVSMLSGLRTDAIRVFGREASFRRRNPDVITLPGLLRSRGYTTVSIGKVFDWPAFSEQEAAAGMPIELCNANVPRNSQPDAASCSFDKSFPTLYCRRNSCVCPQVSQNPYPFGPNPNNRHIPLVWGETQTKYTDELGWDDCHANTAIAQIKSLSKSTTTPWFIAVGFFRPQ